MEIKWKRIAEHPNYAVSNDGQICNIRTHRILRLQCNHKQTAAPVTVKLYNSGHCQRLNVARLVAQAFLDNPYNKPYVCHRNHDCQNNTVANLFWSEKHPC